MKPEKIHAIGEYTAKPTNDLDAYIKAHSFDITREPEEDDTILYLQDIPIGSKENIITITGRSKSRKTVAASAIATAIFAGQHLGFSSDLPEDARILHIDTEQGYKHYYHSVKRIFDDADLLVPARFTSIHTRDADIPLRLELLSHMVNTIRPTVLIVDGVTDLVYDINSQEESTKIGELFLRLSSTHRMLIIAVIHTTKTTGFMTGAIGTILEKKSETVIKVELVEGDPMTSNISCQFSRNKPFKEFAIRADDQNHYSIVDESTLDRDGIRNPISYSPDQHSALIVQIFGASDLIHEKHLKSKLQSCSKATLGDKITSRMLKSFIEHYKKDLWIIDNGSGMYARPLGITPTNQLEIPPTSLDDMPF